MEIEQQNNNEESNDSVVGETIRYCEYIYSILNGENRNAYEQAAKSYSNNDSTSFRGDMTVIYDVFSLWHVPEEWEISEVAHDTGLGYSSIRAQIARNYVDSIISASREIFGWHIFDKKLNWNGEIYESTNRVYPVYKQTDERWRAHPYGGPNGRNRQGTPLKFIGKRRRRRSWSWMCLCCNGRYYFWIFRRRNYSRCIYRLFR